MSVADLATRAATIRVVENRQARRDIRTLRALTRSFSASVASNRKRSERLGANFALLARFQRVLVWI